MPIGQSWNISGRGAPIPLEGETLMALEADDGVAPSLGRSGSSGVEHNIHIHIHIIHIHTTMLCWAPTARSAHGCY